MPHGHAYCANLLIKDLAIFILNVRLSLQGLIVNQVVRALLLVRQLEPSAEFSLIYQV